MSKHDKGGDDGRGPALAVTTAETRSVARQFWSQSGYLLFTQALVQGVTLGSNVLALAILPLQEVGILALQTAIVAWLYFSHAGSLNHLFNELPRLGAVTQAQTRQAMLRGAVGVLLALSLPIALAGCLPFAFVFAGDIGSQARIAEFFVTTVLAVLGAQWTQAKECDIKARGEPTALACWNLLLALCGALPLLLLFFTPAYHVLLLRTPLGLMGVAVFVLWRGDLTLFKPQLQEVAGYIRGGFHLVVCQALSVLILQGERLLLAHRAGVAAVGEMQLYFLLQTGVQLIPATATNLWFPRARRDPDPALLRSSMARAMRFSLVTLGGIAVASLAVGFALQQGWAGERFRLAASGLILGGFIAPAHAFGSLLFVFMARDRVPLYVLLQVGVLGGQILLYNMHPQGWSIQTLVLVRGAMLYAALAACLATALRVARE